MCGRYSQTQIKEAELKKRFGLKNVPEDLKPLYNIAPQQNVPVVLNEKPESLSLAQWGLIPAWAKEITTQYSMINARAETITEKSSYRSLIKKRRCLIIASSFYEWKKTNGAKQPYRILLKDEGLFAFAGIWDRWEGGGHSITSCSIITTQPNQLMKDIHDRMPVILPKEQEKYWLKSNVNIDDILALLKPFDDKLMVAYKISSLVNSPVNNTPAVIKAL